MTTCQICGRAYKTVNGRLAYHGYKQPWRRVGDGARTASCDGSRQLPYEEGCGAIPPAIERRLAMRDHHNTTLARLTRDPPEKLSYRRSSRAYDIGEVARPADFEAPGKPDYRPASYVTQYQRLLRDLRAEIKGLNQDISLLRQRLADWPPPGGKST